MVFHGEDCIFHTDVSALYSKWWARFSFCLDLGFKSMISTSPVMWDEFVRCAKPDGESALHKRVRYRDLCSVLAKSMKSTGHCVIKRQHKCCGAAFELQLPTVSTHPVLALELAWANPVLQICRSRKSQTDSREHICLHNYFRKTFERFCAVFNFLLKKKKEMFGEAS